MRVEVMVVEASRSLNGECDPWGPSHGGSDGLEVAVSLLGHPGSDRRACSLRCW